jgi:hypothetical protein
VSRRCATRYSHTLISNACVHESEEIIVFLHAASNSHFVKASEHNIMSNGDGRGVMEAESVHPCQIPDVPSQSRYMAVGDALCLSKDDCRRMANGMRGDVEGGRRLSMAEGGGDWWRWMTVAKVGNGCR